MQDILYRAILNGTMQGINSIKKKYNARILTYLQMVLHRMSTMQEPPVLRYFSQALNRGKLCTTEPKPPIKAFRTFKKFQKTLILISIVQPLACNTHFLLHSPYIFHKNVYCKYFINFVTIKYVLKEKTILNIRTTQVINYHLKQYRQICNKFVLENRSFKQAKRIGRILIFHGGFEPPYPWRSHQ